MAKNSLEILSRIALFRDKETEPGSPSTTGGVSIDFDSGSGINSLLAAEHDGDAVRGVELPTNIYAAHREASGTLSQRRAKPDFIAFVLAYFLGQCQSASVGTNGYRHTVTPISGLDPPTFTCIQRRGANLFTERHAGLYIESFTLDLGEGWVSMSAEVIGTGARDVNYEHEVVVAAANTSSITLSANAVEGNSAAERLANLYRVRAKDTGESAWTTLSVSAVSDATPAVIGFDSPLGSGTSDVDFHVDYIPAEPTWCELPNPVDESPLKLVEAKVVVDGFWNGSSIEGGEELGPEVLALSIGGKNNLELSRFPGASGPAARAVRGGREITISLTESLRDTTRQYQADNPDVENVAVALLVQGAEIDEGAGYYFGAEIVFPRCGIIQTPVVVEGKRLAQAGDLVVLDDGAIIRCYNKQAGYL